MKKLFVSIVVLLSLTYFNCFAIDWTLYTNKLDCFDYCYDEQWNGPLTMEICNTGLSGCEDCCFTVVYYDREAVGTCWNEDINMYDVQIVGIFLL